MTSWAREVDETEPQLDMDRRAGGEVSLHFRSGGRVKFGFRSVGVERL